MGQEEGETATKLNAEKPKDDDGDKLNLSPETTAATVAAPADTPVAAAPSAQEKSGVKLTSTVNTLDTTQADDKSSVINKGSTEEDTTAKESSNDEKKSTTDGDPPADKKEESAENKTESTSSTTKETSSTKPTTTDPASQPKGAETSDATKISSEDKKKNSPPDDAMDIDDPPKDKHIKETKSDNGKEGFPEPAKESTKKVGQATTSDSVSRNGDQKPRSATSHPAPSNEKSRVSNTPDVMELDPVVETEKTSGQIALVDKKEEPKSESSANDTDEEVFENRVPLHRPRKKKKTIQRVQVKLCKPVRTRDTESKSSEIPSLSSLPPSSQAQQKTFTTAERMLALDEEFWGPSPVNEKDDALSFFEETHEEQDPAFDEYVQRKKKDDLKTQLAELDVRDREGRQEIESLINRLSKEKRESTDKSHHMYREKVDQDEKKEMEELRTNYQERNQLEQTKIQKGLKFLQAKQQKEVNMALRHHSQRRLPEQLAQAEWQKTTMQLQGKHNMQLQEFRKRTEEMTRKTNNEFNIQQEKVTKKYGKKRAEVDSRRDKFVSQQMGQFAQLKQRYLKRHLQKMISEREAINNKLKGAEPERGAKSPQKPSLEAQQAATEKEEHRPPSPIKFVPDWAKDLDHETGESIIRQKHRKGVLSQAVRQLSIEIHNEGIWSLLVRKVEDGSKTETVDEEFMEWGPRAFMTMESVVCGEIPSTYEKLNFSDAPAAQGGQLRCSITDLRTGSVTAAAHRCEAFKEQEASNFTELEKATADLVSAAADAEKAFKRSELEEKHASSDVEKAASFHDKAKKDLEAFRAKFHSFLGPDGNPLPTTNANHRQELMQTILRYNANIQMAGSKAAQAHKNMTEAKNRTQRLHLALKAAQRNAVNSTNLLKLKKTNLEVTGPLKHLQAASFVSSETRVGDAVASLSLVAAKRRDQLEQKKNSAFTQIWAQSFPELSDSMKKSLWHRMVRRKQQVILRPTHESLVTELLEKVCQEHETDHGPSKPDVVENEMIKAEQIFLLACHPAPDEPLPAVPTSLSWAEPGWNIDLRVRKTSSSTILPCAPSFPILNKALNDFGSAQGRQAASILNHSSFRTLMAPLVTFSKASSLAEANTELFMSMRRVDGDPFEISSEEMKRGQNSSSTQKVDP
eukprot:scaffold2767_cov177-Amphora_coffeaeformis.AAC.53